MNVDLEQKVGFWEGVGLRLQKMIGYEPNLYYPRRISKDHIVVKYGEPLADDFKSTKDTTFSRHLY